MKAIYTIQDNKVFRISQNTNLPLTMMVRPGGTSSRVEVDSNNRAVTQNITINTLVRPGLKSNAELFNDMILFLKDNLITEINYIQNFYKIYVDYVIEEDGVEVDHSVVIRNMEPVDKLVPLGVATNNECVYRRVKTFAPNIEFRTRNVLPHGIMDNRRKKYTLRIHDICVFQDFNKIPEIHESDYEAPHGIHSNTMSSALTEMMLIYSSHSEGIEIQPMELNFQPRHITISLNIILSNMIVAYNDGDVTRVLEENLQAKYPIEEPDDPGIVVPDPGPGHQPGEDPEHPGGDGGDEPSNPNPPGGGTGTGTGSGTGSGTGTGGNLIPDVDNNADADGEYEPDDDGFFDYYERATSTNPFALQVVEDLIPDANYNPKKMIRISKVLRDIPDIAVGEFVLYRESFVS